jgi:hypothetical protein
MKPRLLLIALLSLSSGPAYAEWVLFSETQTGLTVYVDPDTIRREGDLVKMWQLLDYKTIQTVAGDSFLSSKTQSEYDCAGERMRVLEFMNFSGNMGSGSDNVVSIVADEKTWIPIVPESPGKRLWKVACAKK